MSSLRKFFIQYTHFLSGSSLTLLLGLISFPILTRILTHEEYGIMGLVNTTLFLAVALAKGGLSDGIIRFYKEYSESNDKLAVFSSTIMIRGLVLSLLTALLYISIFPFISGYLNINAKYVTVFIIMAIYLFVRPLNIIVLNMLRVTGKTIFYNSINIIDKILSIGFSLLLLIYLLKGLYGYFIGIILAEIIVSIILFYWFLSNYKIIPNRVSGELAVKLIKFGTPLLITELSYLLLSYADRYMIVAYYGEEVLGLYSVGYNLASYLSNIIMFSLSYTVVPIYVDIYEKDGKEKTEEFLQRCLHYLIIAVIPVFFGYLAISNDLFITLASVKYASAAAFSPIILLGALFLGINYIFNAGLYLKKKSMTLLAIMLSAVVINIILNIILLPQYGVMGAAIATLLACIATTIATILLSYRYIVVRADIKAALYYLILSCIMYFAVKQIETGVVWVNLASKIIAGVLIIAPGVLFREDEIRNKLKSVLPLRFNKSKIN